MVVEVEQVFMHCSKSLIRSGLWQPEKWPALDGVPTLAQWVKSVVDNPSQSLEDVQATTTTMRRNACTECAAPGDGAAVASSAFARVFI